MDSRYQKALRANMADLAVDPHLAARTAIETVVDTPMQSLVARLSATPGVLRWPGRRLDADGDDIRRRGWGDDAIDDAGDDGVAEDRADDGPAVSRRGRPGS